MSEEIYSKLDSYGVRYSGEQVSTDYHKDVSYHDQLTLAEVDAAGGKIVRVRILTENVYGQHLCDISYIYATIPAQPCPRHVGSEPVAPRKDCYPSHCVPEKKVPVYVDVANFEPLWGPKGLKSRFIQWATEQKVSAKKLGLLDEGNWSILYG